eukprot:scaffold5965_cov109-Ochromonas_danica.AAC.2
MLSWIDPYDEGNAITGYRVYRSSNGGNTYAMIADYDASVTSMTDSGLNNGHRYFYAVTALNDNGEGPRSTVVSEYPSTVPDAPTITGLANSASSGVGGQLTLSWHENPISPSNGGDVIIQFDIKDCAMKQLLM